MPRPKQQRKLRRSDVIKKSKTNLEAAHPCKSSNLQCRHVQLLQGLRLNLRKGPALTRPPLKHLPQRLRRKVQLLVSPLMPFLNHQPRQLLFLSTLVKYQRQWSQNLLADHHQDQTRNKIR